MTDPLLLWGLGLLAAAALLVIVEVFIPSGGIIAITSGVVAVAGIVSLFRHDTTWGLIGVLLTVLCGPVIFGFAIKMLPNTPIGRRMLGVPDEGEVREQHMREQEERDEFASLQGEVGEVLSDLRPVGVVRINGKRYDALAEGAMVEAGSRVRVTVVNGRQIKVRQVDA